MADIEQQMYDWPDRVTFTSRSATGKNFMSKNGYSDPHTFNLPSEAYYVREFLDNTEREDLTFSYVP